MTTILGNTDADGNAKAITAGCYKYGGATLLNWGGATMTYVIEIYEPEARKT